MQGGYLEVRVKPGAPGIGEAVTIPVDNDLVVVTAKLPGRTTTPRMLSELKEKINILGKGLVGKLLEKPTIEEFLELSHEFTVNLGIIDRKIIDRIEKILKPLRRQGVLLGHYYKKNLLVIVAEIADIPTIEETLRGQRLDTLIHKLSPGGIKVILA